MKRAQADGRQRIDAVLYVEENPDDRGTYYVTLGTEDYPERYLVGDMYGEPSADRAALDFVDDILDTYRIVAAYEVEDFFFGEQLDEPVVVRELDLGPRVAAFDAPHTDDPDGIAVLALRQSLEGENQAIYDYQNWIDQLPEGHPVRDGLLEIMREERAHVGELQQMLFEMNADEEPDFEGGRREVSASVHSGTSKTAYSGYTFGKREGKTQMRFAYTVKDNVTKDVYDCETVGDLEDCLRDITPEDAPGYELIDDIAQMANDNYFVDLENALGVTITANRGRRGAAGARRRKSAGMYNIPGGAIETYQEDGRWYARAFQYGEYATGRCYGRSEEEAVNKCKKELGKWGVEVAGRRARRNAPRRASRRKVAANGASFSNGWTMYLDTRRDGSFDVTLYDPDGREVGYGKTFTAGDESSLARQLKGIMAWRAPMDADDDDKIDEMAAKAFGR